MITTLILALGIGVVVTLAIQRLPLRLPAANPGAPTGLGGWMIPPVIGVTLSPIILLRTLWTFFDQIGMAHVFQRLDLTVRYLMLGELLLLGILVVVSVYCVWSLYRQLPTFPAAFVLIHMLSWLSLAIDTAALVALGEPGKPQLMANESSLVLRTFVSAIWVSYVLISQRVRATFVAAPIREGEYHGRRELRPLEVPAKPAMDPGAT